MTKRKTQGEKQGRQTNKDGYKTKKKVPPKRRPKTVLAEIPGSQNLVSQAISGRWGDGDRDRWETDLLVEDLQKRQAARGLTVKERALLAVITDISGIDSRQRQMAISNVLRMEAQNQLDQPRPAVHIHGHKHVLGNPEEIASILEAIDKELADRRDD
jgi:hypothetical protein